MSKKSGITLRTKVRKESRSALAPRAKRQATLEATVSQAARLQIAREGTVTQLISMLVDLEAKGDITREPEETEINPEDLVDSEAIDSAVELADEDDWIGDEERERFDDLPSPAYRPDGGTIADDESIDLSPGIGLLVEDRQCRLLRAPWMRAEPLTDTGGEFLDEIGHRFTVLRKVASWLSENRKEFLALPDPWLLGNHAFDELKRGCCSVSPGSFLVLSKLDKLASASTFSRNTRNCFLVWKDGTLPLDFIFSPEARNAWAANAIAQAVASQKTQLKEADLEQIARFTRPHTTEKTNQLLSRTFDSLSFPEIVALANRMADTRWNDVLSTYRSKLLQEQ